MPYIINKTNGSILTTIADGTVDNTSDLTLIGKNYSGYGEFLNENFVRLIENFANATAPATPIAGQIWWDTPNSTLKVYVNATVGWKSLAKAVPASAAPSNNVTGDFWWDTTNGQLKVHNGANFVTVGPVTPSGLGSTGAQPETITDTSAASHYVVSLYSGATRVAVVSADPAFTPSPSITGFSIIRPGINLVSTGVVSGAQLTGLASNADTLDNLNSTDFIRANTAAVTSGSLGVLNNTGLTVGANSDLVIGISGANASLQNQTNNGNVAIVVNRGGATTTAINVIGSSGLATVFGDPTTALGICTKSYADNLVTTGSALSRSGTNTITGTIVPNADNSVNFGSSSNRFNTMFTANLVASGTTASTSTATGAAVVTGGLGVSGNINAGGTAVRFTGDAASTSTTTGTVVVTGGAGISGDLYVGGTVYGTATQALYADVAERFEADRPYPAGTVVALGGTAEITAVSEELTDDVFGVISTRAAHLLNAAAGTDETHPPVALTGRVPVRVVGTVKKGDRLVSAGGGLARAAKKEEITSFNVVGRSLETKTTDGEGTVVAVVTLNS